MAEIKAGQYVTDGTSVFILDDVRDGNRVGDIVFRPVLHDGYIKANGATVTASEYPRLLKFAQDNNLLVDSSTWNSDKSKYVYDSGADTLKVPDAQGRVLQGTADTIKSVEAGLPNITGGIETRKDNKNIIPYTSKGVFVDKDIENTYTAMQAADIAIAGCEIEFNAARSSEIYGKSTTVQPPAIALIPQIKY